LKHLFFPSPAHWRRWLATHHNKQDELWVGLCKRAAAKPSITWPEAVDEALCFGWIDSVRRSIDEESYTIRFTPRRSSSTWSTANVNRVAELIKNGRMRPAGLRAYNQRTRKNTGVYSFEQRRRIKLPRAYGSRFKAKAGAWGFFSSQAPWYQRTATFWVVSAKREETRLKRLATLIEDSAHGRTIAPLRRTKKMSSAGSRR
jgi:uncharacterized protein YdeI (YjbR/CyaY-like superfamily)